MKKVLFIDYNKCIGCETCQSICEFIHRDKPFIKIFQTSTGLSIPITCHHCENAPCLNICPTKAIYKDEDDAVIINTGKCIGCYMCLAVCPFGIPSFDIRIGAMNKCDMCADRRKKALAPACSEMCPCVAIFFGEPQALEQTIKAKIAEELA